MINAQNAPEPEGFGGFRGDPNGKQGQGSSHADFLLHNLRAAIAKARGEVGQ